MSNQNNIPWVDKYRPIKLDHIIHQDEVKKVLKNTVKTGELPHLLFYGPPGTGKTSTILALGYELFGPRVMNDRILELNASDEHGIDTVRDKIITFAKETICTGDPKYPSPPFKIIILDEADAITLDAQSALRKIIETSSRITRFCFTCNYIEKIIDPIISRCIKFRFKPIDASSLITRLRNIGIKEKLVLDDSCYNKIFESSEGDARRAIMTLQNIKYISKNKITLQDINKILGSTTEEVLKDIWEKTLIQSINDILILVKNIINNCINIDDLITYFKTRIIESKYNDKIKSSIIFILCNTNTRLTEGGDEFINVLYMLSQINNIINS